MIGRNSGRGRVARTCFLGPRLSLVHRGRAADLKNRSALRLLNSKDLRVEFLQSSAKDADSLLGFMNRTKYGGSSPQRPAQNDSLSDGESKRLTLRVSAEEPQAVLSLAKEESRMAWKITVPDPSRSLP